MSKDRTERKLYRKSPGRQYGYEYDPLQSHGDQQKGRQSGHLSSPEETTHRTSSQLIQRPDIRRTRKLLRDNILASKRPTGEEEGEQLEQQAELEDIDVTGHTEQEASEEYHRPTRGGRLKPSVREPVEEEYEEELVREDWQDHDVDPDQGDEEDAYYPEVRPRRSEEPPARTRSSALPPATRDLPPPRRAVKRSKRLAEPVIIDDDEYEDDENLDSRGKRKVSRRGLITGIGIVAIGGASVAAYELIPKIPQAVNNVEHQVQDAFNKGVIQGGDAARRAFLTELDNLEGFTLQGAVGAAKLTRVSYDVFVSPIVKFGSAVAADFLTAMLNGFKAARRILAYINQDNDTLAAIQKVLETWVQDVANLPEQLDAITDTDLDGAQAYLNALQQKIAAEKAKLNATPTPAPTPKPSSTQTPAH